MESELTSYLSFKQNWDGEGASPPNKESISLALATISKLKKDNWALLGYTLPEENGVAQLHANGNCGLLWNTPTLYVDLEFASTMCIFYINANNKIIKGTIKEK